MQVNDNKILFKELCYEHNIHIFNGNEQDTFFNNYLKGTINYPDTNRKQDYYKWCILDLINKNLYIYDDNITHKFNEKYKSLRKYSNIC